MQDKAAEDDSAGFVRQCRIEDRSPRSKPETRQRIPPVIKDSASLRVEETIEVIDRPISHVLIAFDLRTNDTIRKRA